MPCYDVRVNAKSRNDLGSLLRLGAGLAVGAYATYAATTWLRYGIRSAPSARSASDSLLDRFMPDFEVSEYHQIPVDAPAQITYDAAYNLRIADSPVVQALFSGREFFMRSAAGSSRALPGALIPEMIKLGWGVLSEIPDRQIVLGAVTEPWMPSPKFRALGSADFKDFREPGHAKIVVTIAADPDGLHSSIAWTETRVQTTDAESRERFRLYWSLLSPGILLIRKVALGMVKAEAERRVRADGP